MDNACYDMTLKEGDKSLAGRVVCAMSGGVDSSVAALLLHQAGRPVVGVSMQVWDYRNHGGNKGRATCCAPTDFQDARRVAAKIGIAYYVMDLEEYFGREVIDKFVSSYQAGLTPNPCVDCNRKVKFRELRRRALSFGCTHVATGHYAKVTQDEKGFHLLRGADVDKDQSYFLYGMSQEELASTLFPLGDLIKPEVRRLAREYNLATAEKPESQDICFVSSSVQEFIESRVGTQPGSIVTKIGKKIGEHSGIHSFTVGQRKGLGLGGSPQPLYVVEIDPAQNQVIVGEREELEREEFEVEDITVVGPELLKKVSDANYPFEFATTAQLRHRHKGVKATVKMLAADRATVRFAQEWATVTPGQAAVFYCINNCEVLAGGRIALERARKAA